jgi:hypothetical protein
MGFKSVEVLGSQSKLSIKIPEHMTLIVHDNNGEVYINDLITSNLLGIIMAAQEMPASDIYKLIEMAEEIDTPRAKEFILILGRTALSKI